MYSNATRTVVEMTEKWIKHLGLWKFGLVKIFKPITILKKRKRDATVAPYTTRKRWIFIIHNFILEVRRGEARRRGEISAVENGEIWVEWKMAGGWNFSTVSVEKSKQIIFIWVSINHGINIWFSSALFVFRPESYDPQPLEWNVIRSETLLGLLPTWSWEDVRQRRRRDKQLIFPTKCVQLVRAIKMLPYLHILRFDLQK